MAYHVSFANSVVNELDDLKAYDRKRIISEIEKQLVHQPKTTSKNRKCLTSVVPKFEYEPPLWELRVGQYRVLYDVKAKQQTVIIRPVRLKKPEQRTEDIVQ